MSSPATVLRTRNASTRTPISGGGAVGRLRPTIKPSPSPQKATSLLPSAAPVTRRIGVGESRAAGRYANNETSGIGARETRVKPVAGVVTTASAPDEPLSLLAQLRRTNELPNPAQREKESKDLEVKAGPAAVGTSQTRSGAEAARQRAEISEKIRKRNQEQIEKAQKAGAEKRRKAEERRDMVRRQLEEEARQRASAQLVGPSSDPVVQMRRELNQERAALAGGRGPTRRPPLDMGSRPARGLGLPMGIEHGAVGQSMDEEMQLAIIMSRMEAMSRAAEDDELQQVIAMSMVEAGLDPVEEGFPPSSGAAGEPDMTYESLLELEDVEVGVPPMVFAAVRTKSYMPMGGDDEAPSCPVCMCEYEVGDDMKVLDCRHEFHTECLEEWCKRKNACPICKARIG